MTTQYAILLPGDEQVWENATDEERREVYAVHAEFARVLAERGHKVNGGAELAPSRSAKVVRGRLDQVTVTDGPYAETAEQLTGFYLVETDDLDDLMNVCGLLGWARGSEPTSDTIAGAGAVEVRECLQGDGAEADA